MEKLFQEFEFPEGERDKFKELYRRTDVLSEAELLKETVPQYTSLLIISVISVLLVEIVSPILVFFLFSSVFVGSIYFSGVILPKLLPSKEISFASNTTEESDVVNAVKESFTQHNMDDTDYSVYVINIDFPLAFALPISVNPSIFITTAQLNTCTKDELVAILSHELGHQKTSYFINTIWAYLNLSVFPVAAIVSIFTSINTTQLAICVAIYALGSKILSNYVGHKTEKFADSSVPEEYRFDFARALVKMKKKSFYVTGFVGSTIHTLFDEHPPLNHRIESSLQAEMNDNYVKENYTKQTNSIKTSVLLIGVIIGTIFISLGILGLISNVYFAKISYAGFGAVLLLITQEVYSDSSNIISSIGRVSIPLVLLFLLGYIVNYLTNQSYQMIEVLGYGVITAVIAISILSSVIQLFIIVIYADSDSEIEIPSMPTDPYKSLEGNDSS